MTISFKNINIYFEHISEFDWQRKSIIFLHGFTGSANDWKNVATNFNKRFNKVAIDLIGHGKSSSPANIEFYKIDSVVEQIEEVINYLRIKEFILCGYSMGGRVALSYAVKKPNIVKGLILESSSSGIKKIKEREVRKKNDDELAEYILNNPIEDFINKWLDQEIFGTIRRFSNEKIKRIKEEKTKNSRIGLANSLRGFGTGIMPYLDKELKRLNIPVLLLSGQLDSKFTKLNVELNKLIPKSKHVSIQSAGHNIHLEEPSKFIKAVNKYLKIF